MILSVRLSVSAFDANTDDDLTAEAFGFKDSTGLAEFPIALGREDEVELFIVVVEFGLSFSFVARGRGLGGRTANKLMLVMYNLSPHVIPT